MKLSGGNYGGMDFDADKLSVTDEAGETVIPIAPLADLPEFKDTINVEGWLYLKRKNVYVFNGILNAEEE